MTNLLAQFMASLEAEGLSPRTLEGYRAHVTRFLDWGNLTVVTSDTLTAYQAHLLLSLSPASVGTYMIGVKRFVAWLEAAHPLLVASPLRWPAPPRAKRNPPRVAVDKDVQRVVHYVQPHIRLAILLMYRMGIRIGEVLSLQWDEVDLAKGEVLVHRKGGDTQRLPILGGDLITYLRESAQESGYVVDGSRSMVSRAIANACAQVGVGPINPHSLRHRFAINAATEGRPILAVSAMLGHARLSTTDTYLRGFQRDDPDYLRGAMNDAE